ncbi:MAG: hypothetical protein VW338_16020, partial [Rhodospirillaceae bacterium]
MGGALGRRAHEVGAVVGGAPWLAGGRRGSAASGEEQSGHGHGYDPASHWRSASLISSSLMSS